MKCHYVAFPRRGGASPTPEVHDYRVLLWLVLRVDGGWPPTDPQEASHVNVHMARNPTEALTLVRQRVRSTLAQVAGRGIFPHAAPSATGE
jgi:hypothetical protein